MSAAAGAAPPPTSASGRLDRSVVGVAAVVVLGAILSILDITIVNVAINELAAHFDAGLETIQWVATAYMLALATVIPLTGWAADRFGPSRVFIVSLVLFMAGSTLARLAWSAGLLPGWLRFENRLAMGFSGLAQKSACCSRVVAQRTRERGTAGGVGSVWIWA